MIAILICCFLPNLETCRASVEKTAYCACGDFRVLSETQSQFGYSSIAAALYRFRVTLVWANKGMPIRRTLHGHSLGVLPRRYQTNAQRIAHEYVEQGNHWLLKGEPQCVARSLFKFAQVGASRALSVSLDSQRHRCRILDGTRRASNRDSVSAHRGPYRLSATTAGAPAPASRLQQTSADQQEHEAVAQQFSALSAAIPAVPSSMAGSTSHVAYSGLDRRPNGEALGPRYVPQ